MCAFPHHRSSARSVASMAPQYHCCARLPVENPLSYENKKNRRLLQKRITLERKGISLSPRFVNLALYGKLFDG